MKSIALKLCWLLAVSVFPIPMDALCAPLYVLKDSRGVITITSQKPKSGGSYRVVTGSRSPRYSKFITMRGWTSRAYSSTKYDAIIRSKAVEHDVDPALVKAVIHAESAFNPTARSPKGALGLMQLMPATAQRFGVDNAYFPEQNIQGGVRYLSFLIARYNGDLRLALAAYNAGEGVVDEIRDIPPYRETREYVRRVMTLLPKYRAIEAKKN